MYLEDYFGTYIVDYLIYETQNYMNLGSCRKVFSDSNNFLDFIQGDYLNHIKELKTSRNYFYGSLSFKKRNYYVFHILLHDPRKIPKSSDMQIVTKDELFSIVTRQIKFASIDNKTHIELGLKL